MKVLGAALSCLVLVGVGVPGCGSGRHCAETATCACSADDDCAFVATAPCQRAQCQVGVCGVTVVDQGTPCIGGVCDALGQCVPDDGSGGSGGGVGGGGQTGGGGAAPERTVVDVSAGAKHTCAVVSDGTLWCWGDNSVGQLGLGMIGGSVVAPTQVEALAGVTDVEAGDEHTCALAGGRAWCWGSNEYGELGLGAAGAPNANPQDTGQDGTAMALTLGGGPVSTCLQRPGGVDCWGSQLDGSIASYLAPTAIFTEEVDEIVAGGDIQCARIGLEMRCWGANWADQISDNPVDYETSPVQVFVGVDDIGPGSEQVCAVTGQDVIACRGELAAMGEQGILSAVVEVELGGLHGCAVLSDKTVWCWGANSKQQLGNASITDPWVEAPIKVEGITGVVHLVTGRNHACTRSEDGTLTCWGDNEFGQLGNGSTSPTASPVEIDTPR